MSHENAHGAVLTVFSEGEQQRFWVDDKAAATAVVTLLAGIFTIGLIGYICVSLWVNAQPNFPDYYF
jgi:hypothetical protein